MMSRGVPFACALLLSGCAGVFNPYVSPRPDVTPGNKPYEPVDCRELEDSMCSALNLAERYRLAYLDAAGNQQAWRNTFAVAGLVAATATLYYGLRAHDKYQNRVIGFATLGGASYAAGTYFTSSPRQQAYLDGATAMSCAMIAAAPAMIPKVGQNELREDLDTLQRELADVQGSTSGTSDPLTLQVIATGESTLQSGTEMLAHLTTSGIVLRARIEVLANAVNHQVLAQLPDLNSLYSLAGSMTTFAEAFGSQRLVSTTTKTGATASSSGGGTQKTPDLTKLQAAITRINTHLRFAAIAAQSFNEVAACSPDGISDAFAVSPSDATVSVEKDKTYSFTVTDKRGHPSAKVSGANADKVELQPIQIQGESYLVVVKGKEATGMNGPTLLISESNGLQSHAVNVMVSSPDNTNAPPAKPQTPAANTPRNNSIEAAFLKDPLKILAVQCVVGALPDCVMGDKTRSAIRDYKNKQNPGAANDDAIDAALQSAAGKLNLPPTACSAKPISCSATP